MKYHMLGLGAILVLYAIFLTPAYFEPTDIVCSTGYIVIANEMGIDPIVVFIWALSGYIALIAGIMLGFGSMIHFKHPLALSLIALCFGAILFYWIYFQSGLVN